MENNIFKKVLRVALYVRVSTEEQVQHGYSLEAQETALIDFATKNGFKIAKIYRDEGFSARKPVMRRKVMQELLQDVQAGQIDLILFTKLDRWFRNVRDYHTIQTVLDRAGVSWKAILEDYNTTTADGRLKVNIMLSVAENEADRTSERIKFVFANKVKNGEYCFGGAAPPYGYKTEIIDGVRKLVKDPETEAIVVTFWEKMLKYRNIRQAGRETNLQYGIYRAHKSWMLFVRNEIYTGRLRGIDNFCPAYISYDDWKSLQRPENRIKSTQGGRHYLFVGLLRCPVCGATLKATFKTYPNDRSKEYYSYRCNAKALGNCTYKHTISERKLEKYLLANIVDALEEYAVKTEIAAAAKKKPQKKADTNKLAEQLRRLNVIYMSGNISDNEYNAQAGAIRSALAAAEQEQKETAKPINLTAIRNIFNDNFGEMYQTMSREEKQRFWHTIISAIHFNDNQVKEIVFRV